MGSEIVSDIYIRSIFVYRLERVEMFGFHLFQQHYGKIQLSNKNTMLFII